MWVFQFFHIALFMHIWSFLFGWSQQSWRRRIFLLCSFVFPSLIKCPVFIAKCYRLYGFKKRSVFLSILKIQHEGTRTLLCQKCLSTANCSTESDYESIRRKIKARQSHRNFSPLRFTFSCLPITGAFIHAQLLPGQSHIVSSCVTKRQLWHHHPLSRGHSHRGACIICVQRLIQDSPSILCLSANSPFSVICRGILLIAECPMAQVKMTCQESPCHFKEE